MSVATTAPSIALKPITGVSSDFSLAAFKSAWSSTETKILVALALVAGLIIAFILPMIWTFVKDTFGVGEAEPAAMKARRARMQSARRNGYNPMPGVPAVTPVTEIAAKSKMSARQSADLLAVSLTQ